MAVSLAEFCAALTDLNLVSGAEFRDIMAGRSAAQVADVESFAKSLIARKTLTKYQSQAILSGQAKRLVLGSYLLVDQIGQGGMGVVLKARHLRLKRFVAIKVLSPQVTKNPVALKRFQREVQAAAKLEHPNIVAAFDADVARGVHFLVMQYIEGRDLAVTIQEQGPFSVEQALQCMSQAACGLEFAHSQGVTHRDIKPANFLLEKGTGTVKVLDMGLARIDEAVESEGSETGLTQTGTMMGTVDFMSPEQAANTKKADFRSDIYSLGVTFYYLLTGELLYNGDTMMEKLLAHRETPIPSLRQIRADVPEAVDALFRKMVAKNPADRYQTMSEVLAALLACLSGAPTTAPAPGSFRVAVAEDSMDSEFRAFVTGLNKEHDTDVGFVPGQGTEVTATESPTQNHVSPTQSHVRTNTKKPRSSTITPVKPLQSKSVPQWNWQLIAAGAVGLIVIVGGIGWLLGGSGKAPPVKKSKASPKQASTDQTSRPKSVPEQVTEPEPENARTAIDVGSPPALAKLPPLPAGEPVRVLPGLIVEPGKIAGLNRWQIETVAPRSTVTASAWAPDNKQIVIGCQSGELRIYEPATWRLWGLMAAHPGGVRSVAWNPDGSRIASSGHDNLVRLWQADGTPGPVLRHCPSPWTLAWSPDGQHLIAASTDRNRAHVQMWTADGKPERLFSGHTQAIKGLAWSTDGRHFITASEDATLRIWDLNGKTVQEIAGHAKGLHSVSWSSTGAIATADLAGSVYVYPDSVQPPSISKKISPRGLAWSPDGKQLAVGLSAQIQLWDADGQLVLKQANIESQNFAWSPDGTRLIGCGQTAMLWEPGEAVSPLVTHAWTTSLAFHPQGSEFISAHANGALRWWGTDGKPTHATSTTDYSTPSVAWSPDARMVASATRNQVKLWLADGQPKLTIDARVGVHQVKWSPDGKRIAAACSDNKVRLWEIDGTVGPVLEGHTQSIQGIDWSRNGQLVSAGRDRKLRLWNSDGTAESVIDLTPQQTDVFSIAWSPDGSQFAAGISNKSDTRIQLWNSEAVEGPGLKGPKPLVGLVWSPDGERLIGSESGGEFRTWTPDGRQGPTFPGLAMPAKILAWSKQDHLVTTGDDRVLRGWEATTFKPLWVAVTLANGDVATVGTNGKVLHSIGKVEQTVVCLVERDNGRIEVLTPGNFNKLAVADARR